MKKTVALILAVLLLTTSFPFSVFALEQTSSSASDPIITLTNKNQLSYSPAGESFEINVDISDNPGIFSAEMSLTFGENLTLTKAAVGDAFALFTPTPPSGFIKDPQNSLVFTGSKSSGCSFALFNNDASSDNGTVLTLTFEVAEAAPVWSQPHITLSLFAEGTEDEYEVSADFSLTVIDYIPGDVNGDKKISLLDAIMISQYITDGRKYDPEGYAVQLNEAAANVSGDTKITLRDAVLISQFIADRRQYDPDGYGVIFSVTVPACSHSFTSIPAKAPTCTEPGNTAYWHCSVCDKHFSDAEGKSEVELEDTVIAIDANKHSFTDTWSSDADYHWHASTCGHDAVAQQALHLFGSDNNCTVCNYQKNVPQKLESPEFIKAESDKLHWTAVPNAEEYTVRVNDNYVKTLRGTSCDLSLLSWDGMKITEHGMLAKLEIWANAHDNYLDSDKAVYSEGEINYYYVPNSENPKADTLINCGIGKGYNLVDDEYLDMTKASTVGVFNVQKLLTVGKLSEMNNSDGKSSGYSYSSIDEFISKKRLKVEVGAEAGIDLIGSLKTQLSQNYGVDYRNYKYNETYVFESSVLYKDYKITDFDINLLKYCLSPAFLADIQNPEMTAEQIMEKYGTHAVLGVTTGGIFSALYRVSTNEETVAESARTAFQIGGGINVTEILNSSLNVGVNLSTSKSWKDSSTEANFETYWKGGSGGAASSASGIESAMQSWSGSMNENTAVSVKFTENGAISLVSLIRLINGELADELEAYINQSKDAAYDSLFGQFSVPNDFASVYEENGNTVLKLDLSSFQSSGSMENASNLNLFNRVLTVYPTMFGKQIDQVVVVGGMDKIIGEGKDRKLIDSLSLFFASNWNRDVKVTLKNVGAITSSDVGFIDFTKTNAAASLTVEYEGLNILRDKDGKNHLYVGANRQSHAFTFSLDGKASLDLNSAVNDSGTVCLPVAQKPYYGFAGWVDQNGEQITDSRGQIITPLENDGIVRTLTAKWLPATFRISLNNQSATEAGSNEFFAMYNTGFFGTYDSVNGAGNALTHISVPVRANYVFKGYYASVENNATASALGTTMYIDSEGKILVEDVAFTENTTLYALWIPAVYTLTLDPQSAASAGTQTIYQQYLTGFYLDSACNTPLSGIQVPVKPGFVFSGYYLSVSNNNSASAVGTDMVIDAEGRFAEASNPYSFTQDTTLYAMWTVGTYTVTLNSQDATWHGTDYLYEKYGVDFFLDTACNTVASNITVPTRDGYIFGGYYESVSNNHTPSASGETQWIAADGSFSVNAEATTENTTLYALWTPNTYTIVFDANGGSVSMTSMVCTYGQYYTLPAVTRDGCTLQYWIAVVTNGDQQNTLRFTDQLTFRNMTKPGTTITLTAQWNPIAGLTRTFYDKMDVSTSKGIEYTIDGIDTECLKSAGYRSVTITVDAYITAQSFNTDVRMVTESGNITNYIQVHLPSPTGYTLHRTIGGAIEKLSTDSGKVKLRIDFQLLSNATPIKVNYIQVMISFSK